MMDTKASSLRAAMEGYDITDVLGEGAMGLVYRAVRKSDGLPVALKVGMAADFPLYAERFERELLLCRGLDHPNVVKILDGGIDQKSGTCFIVMEYLEGSDLLGMMRKGNIDGPTARSVCGQTARALSYIHSRSLFHRDVKPSNIFVESSGRVVLIDFGLIKADYLGKLTATGLLLGTPCYMAPEIFKGVKLDCRIDIYGLGASLYHALSGRPPVSAEKIALYLAGRIPGPHSIEMIRPDVDRCLARCIMRCIRFDRDERFANAGDLQAALREGLDTAPKTVTSYVDRPGGGVPIENPGMTRMLRATVTAQDVQPSQGRGHGILHDGAAEKATRPSLGAASDFVPSAAGPAMTRMTRKSWLRKIVLLLWVAAFSMLAFLGGRPAMTLTSGKPAESWKAAQAPPGKTKPVLRSWPPSVAEAEALGAFLRREKGFEKIALPSAASDQAAALWSLSLTWREQGRHRDSARAVMLLYRREGPKALPGLEGWLARRLSEESAKAGIIDEALGLLGRLAGNYEDRTMRGLLTLAACRLRFASIVQKGWYDARGVDVQLLERDMSDYIKGKSDDLAWEETALLYLAVLRALDTYKARERSVGFLEELFARVDEEKLDRVEPLLYAAATIRGCFSVVASLKQSINKGDKLLEKSVAFSRRAVDICRRLRDERLDRCLLSLAVSHNCRDDLKSAWKALDHIDPGCLDDDGRAKYFNVRARLYAGQMMYVEAVAELKKALCFAKGSELRRSMQERLRVYKRQLELFSIIRSK